MKRYDFEDTGPPGYPEHMMLESGDGEWVKYEDVLLLIETNEAMYNFVERKCNCVKKYEDLWRYWMCPAHGYKKR